GGGRPGRAGGPGGGRRGGARAARAGAGAEQRGEGEPDQGSDTAPRRRHELAPFATPPNPRLDGALRRRLRLAGHEQGDAGGEAVQEGLAADGADLAVADEARDRPPPQLRAPPPP